MAIPQGRFSTTVVEGDYLPPEGIATHPITNYERGPIAIEDTSEGLLYQNWMLTWDSGTGDVTITPETTGSPVVVLNIPLIIFISFTFDQSGRASFAYMTDTSSYLYWYDTALGQTVTTDLGSDVYTPVLYLDDKRSTQNGVNDMMLYYTKEEGGGTWAVYSRLQRDRFLTEYEMETGQEAGYIAALGMTGELRVQLVLSRRSI
jgi:hypothetical protein